MKEKKNIDRLFQEKFKDFEKNPPERVWKSIKGALTGQPERGVLLLPLWSKIAGAAAVIAVVLLLGNQLFFTEQQPDKMVNAPVNEPTGTKANSTENKSTTSSKSNVTLFKTDTLSESTITSLSQNTDQLKADRLNQPADQQEDDGLDSMASDETTSKSTRTESSEPRKNSVSYATKNRTKFSGNSRGENREDLVKNQLSPGNTKKEKTDPENLDAKDGLAGNQPTTGKDRSKGEDQNKSLLRDQAKAKSQEQKTIQSNHLAETDTDSLPTEKEADKPSIFEDIAKNEKSDDKEKEANGSEEKRLALRPNIAPIYYGSLSGGSAVDPKFADNKAKGEISMAYGVNVSYAVSDRLKIRSGVSKVNMNYNTDGIAFTSSTKAHKLTGLEETHKTQHLAIVGKMKKISSGQELKGNSTTPYTEGKLNQQMSYIEVPFEVEYALLNERFSIDVIGGASSLFLNDDAVRINSWAGTTDLGRADNINTLSFTTNIGLGFGYQLTEDLNFNIEPTFKYQLNGFSGKTDFQPYYFGVYSGVSFRF